MAHNQKSSDDLVNDLVVEVTGKSLHDIIFSEDVLELEKTMQKVRAHLGEEGKAEFQKKVQEALSQENAD